MRHSTSTVRLRRVVAPTALGLLCALALSPVHAHADMSGMPMPTPQPVNVGSQSNGVWVDEHGETDGMGHHSDPTIDCDTDGGMDDGSEDPAGAGRTGTTLDILGNGLSNMGTFTIDAVSPGGQGTGEQGASGYHQDQVWPGSRAHTGSSMWMYDTTKGSSQVIGTVDIPTLLHHLSVDNGEQAVPGKGFHLKLQTGSNAAQNPTFWLNCATPVATGNVQGASTVPTTGVATGLPVGLPLMASGVLVLVAAGRRRRS